MTIKTPDRTIARAMAFAYARQAVRKVRRFAGGMCHHVFDVTLRDGGQLVVRVARPGNERLLQGAVHWHGRLQTAGVPVARILHADFERRDFPFAYLVLERLAGTDLGDTYPRLAAAAKRGLAGRMVELQRAAAGMPEGECFGAALSYDEPGPHRSWNAAVAAQIAICRERIGDQSPLTAAELADLERSASRLKTSLRRVKARPFLDDLTTKNVIVTSDGRLSGVVDFDTVSFGDGLYALGLTRAAFARLGYDSIYTRAWEDALRLDDRARARLALYTALFAAVILSEHGHRFNRRRPVEFDRAGISRLKELLRTEAMSAV